MTTAKSSPTAESAIREFVIARTFDVPRALVWRAWTDPEHVRRWWGPEGYTSPACEMDLRVGGAFSLSMRAPDGAVYPCRGIYREIVEPERIVYIGEAQRGHACGGGLPPRARVTVSFAEHEGRTTLTIRTRFESAAALEAALEAGFGTSWAASLDRLAAVVRCDTERPGR